MNDVVIIGNDFSMPHLILGILSTANNIIVSHTHTHMCRLGVEEEEKELVLLLQCGTVMYHAHKDYSRT